MVTLDGLDRHGSCGLQPEKNNAFLTTGALGLTFGGCAVQWSTGNDSAGH
jgi:hypothetical protein